MRSEYLFDLAHLCNTPPPMVDALRYYDFIQLILHIQAYKKAKSESSNG